MTVKELGKKVKNAVQDKEIALSTIAQYSPAFQGLIDQFAESSGLLLQEVRIRQENEGKRLRINGQMNWKDQFPVGLKMKIEDQGDSDPRIQVDATIAEDQALPVAGLSWFQLLGGELQLVSDPGDADHPASGQFSCTLIAGDTSIPLSAELPGTDGILLQASLSDLQFPTLSDLAELAGGRSLFDLPEEIDQLGAVSLHHLSILFQKEDDNDQYGLADLALSFGPANDWDLLPGTLAMKKVQLTTGFSNPLTPRRAFRGAIKGEAHLGDLPIELAAGKDQPEQRWQFSARIARIGLKELTAQLLEDLSLPQDLLDLHFENVELLVIPDDSAFRLKTSQGSNESWKFPLGKKALSVDGMGFEIYRSDGQLGGQLQGTTELLGIRTDLTARVDQELEFTAVIPEISFLDLVKETIDDFTPPEGLPDFRLGDVALKVKPSAGAFSLQAEADSSWEIPIGPAGLKMPSVQFALEGERSNGRPQISGSIGGGLHLGDAELDLRYNFPGDFVLQADIPEINLSPLLQDLAGTEGLLGLPVPADLLNVRLSDINLMIAPQQKSCSVAGASPLGKTEILINKNQQGKWVFVAGFVPPAAWKFSTLDNSLRPLDELRFDNTLLLLSSAVDNDIKLSIANLPDGVSGFRGLNIYLNLDMTGLGIDDLMDINYLQVSAAIGPNPASLLLTARLDGSFDIAENVALGDMQFRLSPAPTNFSLGVAGAMMVTLDESPLRFLGMMQVLPIQRSVSFSATMLGTWEEPFGVRGLAIGDLALELGMGIVPPPATVAPIIGLAGSMRIGDFSGSAAVKFDSATPVKSMVAASFNELVLQDIVRQFCTPEIYEQIPPEIQQTVLSARMEAVEVYVVPQPTTIGALVYEQGFRFQGKIRIADFDAEFAFLLEFASGFALKATMDPIDIGGILQLRGAREEPNPIIEVDLRLGKKPKVLVAGSVQLLELQADTYISITDSGFEFMVSGRIFHLFEASIEASGANFQGGGDFYLRVYMKNDLLAFLRENAIAAIKEATEDAMQDLENAQQALSTAQQKVQGLQGQINAMRRQIQAERAQHQQKVREAEAAVTAARNKVSGLQRQINALRRTIQAERNRDARRLADAQRNVQNAQNKVNGIQSEINRTKNRIAQLRRDIAAKKRWYDNSGWRKSYRWAEYSAYVSAKGAEITALYGKIGTLEAAKGTAWAALEAARQVVRGLEAAAKTFPIEADPRMAGLITAKKSAEGALTVANRTLQLARKAVATFPIEADPRMAGLITAKKSAEGALTVAIGTLQVTRKAMAAFPIEADPRMAGLIAAKESANLALEGSKQFLEGVQQGIGGFQKVSTFILDKGLGGLLDVREAQFEGQLNMLNGGQVSLELKVDFMKKPHSLAIDFNFHRPLDGVKALAERLLDAVD